MNFLKNKENLKQIALGLIAVLLIGLGFASMDDVCVDESLAKDIPADSVEFAVRNVPEEDLGDVELVSADIVDNDELNQVIEENYYEETRLERDRMYSESVEVYQKLIDSDKTSEDQKAIAVQEISNLTTTKNAIIVAENLIKNKGIEDVVILENDGVVNVIVKTVQLKAEEVSQIQNIVQRELKVDVGDISISRK